MNARQFELNGIVVDDEQPPSFTAGVTSAGCLRQIDANGLDETTRLDRLDEQGRKPPASLVRLFETAEETGQRQNRQLRAARKARRRRRSSSPSMSGRMRSWRTRSAALLGRGQGRAGVGCLDHRVALGLEGQAQHLARGRVVLDDEDGGHGGHRSAPRARQVAPGARRRLGQGLDVDRLRDVAVTARGERLLSSPFIAYAVSAMMMIVATRGIGFEPPRQFETVHPRQLEIHQDQARREPLEDSQRVLGVDRGLHLVALARRGLPSPA